MATLTVTLVCEDQEEFDFYLEQVNEDPGWLSRSADQETMTITASAYQPKPTIEPT